MRTRRETIARFLKYIVAGSALLIVRDFLRGSGAASRSVEFSRKPGCNEVLYADGVYLVGLQEGVSAFAATCPHLGCKLEHQPGTERFRCPCHGSEFALDGRRITGPARNGMQPLNVSLNEKNESCRVHIHTS